MERKKIIILAAAALLVIAALFYLGTDSAASHPGEAKTPSAADVQKGRNYNSVAKEFDQNGFTNVKTVADEDLVFGWLAEEGEVKTVTVDGDPEYAAGEWYPNDVEVVITYHAFPSHEDATEAEADEEETPPTPAEPAITPNFDVRLAKRAAVCAITNYFALDVLTPDGNYEDPSKFHSYADSSGKRDDYYFDVTDWGDWSGVSEDTWHVDHLKLIKYGWQTKFDVGLDVTFDGSVYTISNFVDMHGTTPANTSSFDQVGEYKTVRPELIAEPRPNDGTEIEEPAEAEKPADEPAEKPKEEPEKGLREDQARRAFEYVGEHMFPYGFECHWFSDLREHTQSVDGSWTFEVGVTITNQYGAEMKAIASAYVNNTTETVENFSVREYE